MLDNQYNGDIVAQRKAEVRKRTRNMQIAGGVVVLSTLVGIFLIKIPLLSFIIPAIALVFAVYNGVKIRQIVNHKDQW